MFCFYNTCSKIFVILTGMRIVANIFIKEDYYHVWLKIWRGKLIFSLIITSLSFAHGLGVEITCYHLRKHTMTVINTSSSTFYILSQTISHTYLKLVWHNRISVTFQIHRRLMKNWFWFTKGEWGGGGRCCRIFILL